ncbi:hypothetical protein BCV70DRAFT_114807 [Testicularia cyperi]|uniref:Uncharacterized protein n=1 Tax=Testicularia cyperi TaxID=1882483 RepID=A0A317XLP8_9BASI|nr:hypothetical protein BCV70DRAFT_114807 [Testicularia cyperi]
MSSRRIELFSTSILSNVKVRTRHERYTAVLAIKKIPYIYHDLASDEDAKSRWRRKAKDTQLPGILVDNEWVGSYDDFEEAVEFGELHLFLGIAETPSAAQPQAGQAQPHPAQIATSSKDPSLYPSLPYAPEGAGRLAEPTADEFIDSLGLKDDDISADDVDALLDGIENLPTQPIAAHSRKYVPTQDAATKPLRFAKMSDETASSASPTSPSHTSSGVRASPRARYSATQRSTKVLAAEAAALTSNRKASGALLREAVSQGKALDHAMSESKIRDIVSQDNLDDLFASLGLKDVEINDDEVDDFLIAGAIPQGLRQGGERVKRPSSAADKARDETAARELAHRARTKGFGSMRSISLLEDSDMQAPSTSANTSEVDNATTKSASTDTVPGSYESRVTSGSTTDLLLHKASAPANSELCALAPPLDLKESMAEQKTTKPDHCDADATESGADAAVSKETPAGGMEQISTSAEARHIVKMTDTGADEAEALATASTGNTTRLSSAESTDIEAPSVDLPAGPAREISSPTSPDAGSAPTPVAPAEKDEKDVQLVEIDHAGSQHMTPAPSTQTAETEEVEAQPKAQSIDADASSLDPLPASERKVADADKDSAEASSVAAADPNESEGPGLHLELAGGDGVHDSADVKSLASSASSPITPDARPNIEDKTISAIELTLPAGQLPLQTGSETSQGALPPSPTTEITSSDAPALITEPRRTEISLASEHSAEEDLHELAEAAFIVSQFGSTTRAAALPKERATASGTPADGPSSSDDSARELASASPSMQPVLDNAGIAEMARVVKSESGISVGAALPKPPSPKTPKSSRQHPQPGSQQRGTAPLTSGSGRVAPPSSTRRAIDVSRPIHPDDTTASSLATTAYKSSSSTPDTKKKRGLSISGFRLGKDRDRDAERGKSGSAGNASAKPASPAVPASSRHERTISQILREADAVLQMDEYGNSDDDDAGNGEGQDANGHDGSSDNGIFGTSSGDTIPETSEGRGP